MIVSVEIRAVMSTSMLRKRRSASMFLLWCVFGAGIGGRRARMGMCPSGEKVFKTQRFTVWDSNVLKFKWT